MISPASTGPLISSTRPLECTMRTTSSAPHGRMHAMQHLMVSMADLPALARSHAAGRFGFAELAHGMAGLQLARAREEENNSTERRVCPLHVRAGGRGGRAHLALGLFAAGMVRAFVYIYI
uniref:Uncharacterized protein n=1 Tax=Oryza brachyantha TaxID=4533 RepID=J3L492_ORYBR